VIYIKTLVVIKLLSPRLKLQLVIIQCIINFLIAPTTTILDFYSHYQENLLELTRKAYNLDNIEFVKVTVWDMDKMRNAHIQTNSVNFNNNISKTLNNITPLKTFIKTYSTSSKPSNPLIGITKLNLPKGLTNVNVTKILAMDIETMEFNGIQIPIAISLAYLDNSSELMSKFTLINKDLLLANEEEAIADLWLRFFTFFNKDNFNFVERNLVIFMHNLGSFDGFFLYKGLMNNNLCNYKDVKSMIDKDNEFIQIEAIINGVKITWKDSYRVFNV
jgi:hypothetical protein